MIEIKAINAYGDGRFVIHYIKPSVCMCSFTRHTLIVNRKKEPTNTQALKLIQDDIDNK